MNSDTRIVLSDRLSKAEYPLDFCSVALDILNQGDRGWAEHVYGLALKRARSLDDRVWILMDGLEHDLCPPATQAELMAFLETRKRPLDRLTAIDTWIKINDRTRAAKYAAQWTKRARSVEFLTACATTSYTHALVDRDTIEGWLTRAEGLCRSQDDWYLTTKAWVELGTVENAVRGANTYDALGDQLDDLLITIELLRTVSPKDAVDRCRQILRQSSDAFLLACTIKECVTLCPKLVPQAIFKLLGLHGECHDYLMALHEASSLITPEMCKALINRAVRTADDAFDATDIIKAASNLSFPDICLAVFDHFLQEARATDACLALLVCALDTGIEPLMQRVGDNLPRVIEKVRSTEELVDCIYLLRAVEDPATIEDLLSNAGRYIRGFWDWIDLLSVLDPQNSAKDALRARHWISRASLTTLDPDALSALAAYIERHFEDKKWALQLASLGGTCERGIRLINRLRKALRHNPADLPKLPVDEIWDRESSGFMGSQRVDHPMSLLDQIKSSRKTLNILVEWANRRGIFKPHQTADNISVIQRTVNQLAAIRGELECMAVEARDLSAANGSCQTQLRAAHSRGQIDETIPLFVQSLTSQRDRMWVGD